MSCQEVGRHMYSHTFMEWLPRLDHLEACIDNSCGLVRSLESRPALNDTADTNNVSIATNVSKATNASASNGQNQLTSPKILNSQLTESKAIPSKAIPSKSSSGAIPKTSGTPKVNPATTKITDSRGRKSSDTSSYRSCTSNFPSGKPSNGIVSNGIVSNGIVTNGIVTNGIATNGNLTNGNTENGLPKIQPELMKDQLARELIAKAKSQPCNEEDGDFNSIPTFAQLGIITTLPALEIKSGEEFKGDMCYVKSPSEFYILKTVNEHELKRINLDLEEFYQKNKTMAKAQSVVRSHKDVENLEGTFWVCKFKEDNHYYRVRIVSRNPLESEDVMYVIQYIDYGNCEDVALDELHSMTPSLTQIPAQAIKCSLFNIDPPSGNSWTTDDCEFLENAAISMEKEPLEISVKAVQPPMARSFYPTADVILTNKEDVTGITINERFVEAGIGMFRTVSSSSLCTSNGGSLNETPQVSNQVKSPSKPTQVQTSGKPVRRPVTGPLVTFSTPTSKTSSVKSDGSTKKLGLRRSPKGRTAEETFIAFTKAQQTVPEEVDWDDDLKNDEDILQGNAYGTDIDDPMTAVMGFKTSDVKYCRYYAEGRCEKGHFCPYPHIERETLDNLLLNSTEETCTELMPQESLIKNAVYFIKIISYNSKTRILRVQLPFGNEPLTKEVYDKSASEAIDTLTPFEMKYVFLMKEMAETYSRKESQEQQNIYPTEASLVAVCDGNRLFFRGKVLESQLENDVIEVACLDTGITKKVPRRDVYKLRSEFTLIPSMTYMARLEEMNDESIEMVIKSGSKLGVKVLELDRASGDEVALLQIINLRTHFA